ncbi:MAG: hypothetical protein ACRDRU_02285 [Pseudonocardiaceae bacterium]
MSGAGGTAAGNGALLEEAEMSNAELARAVVSASALEGQQLGTSASTVRRMLEDAQPRWPVPRLVATVLSRRLRPCRRGHRVTTESRTQITHSGGSSGVSGPRVL